MSESMFEPLAYLWIAERSTIHVFCDFTTHFSVYRLKETIYDTAFEVHVDLHPLARLIPILEFEVTLGVCRVLYLMSSLFRRLTLSWS